MENKYFNPLIRTKHTLHDSAGQLDCHAISGKNVVLVIGEPEFMCIFMDEEIALDLMTQIDNALVVMRDRLARVRSYEEEED